MHTFALMHCHLVTVFYLTGHFHNYVCQLYHLTLRVGAGDYSQSVAVHSANCDWSVTSAEALSHREVTLALPPSPCMHVSLLYQTNSLEYQLQLQEAANH